MDERTLTALQGSIAKWEAIVKGQGDDKGVDNCPLCKVFADKEVHDDEDREWAQDGCYGCPVAERVRSSSCARTPYERWASYAWDNRHRGALSSGPDSPRNWYRVFDDRSRELALAELDFLRSLLPVQTAAPESPSTKEK